MEVTGACMIWVELVSMHACLICGACLMGLYSRWVELQGMNIFEYSDPFRNSECYHDTHWDLGHPTLLSDTV